MGGPGSRGTLGNKGHENRRVIHGGQQPAVPPRGIFIDIRDLCNEEPFPGHIRVADFAALLGVSSQSLKHLVRSVFPGFIDERLAYLEVARREAGKYVTELIPDEDGIHFSWKTDEEGGEDEVAIALRYGAARFTREPTKTELEEESLDDMIDRYAKDR